MARRLLSLILFMPLAGCVTTSSLSRAAQQGDNSKIKALLKTGVSINNSVEEGALYHAARNNKLDTVKLLLDRGADPNSPSGYASALHIAVYKGNKEVTALLLTRGANAAARDDGGAPVLLNVGHIVTTYGSGKIGSRRAVEMAELLLKNGAEIDAANKYNNTPLIVAAWLGVTDLVKLYIRHGAALDITGDSGTALDDARQKGHHQIVAVLERAARRTSLENASARPAPAAPARPLIHSDVDTPNYHSPEHPDDFAIVVGIDDYKNLPNAEFAERDAQAMRDHLIAMGYPKRHVVLLKGDAATGNGMRKYLEEWLPRNVKPTSTVFFYYSGHGAPEVQSGKAYLVPWDGDASFLKSTAYPVEKLYASLNKLKAKQIIVALDACFSGAGGRSVLAKGARPLVTKVNEGFSRKSRIVLFTAASGSEITTTIEDEGHGIFTYFFLKGLQGAAKDTSGNVTAKSLQKYLKPKVQEEARLQNREQTPTLHTTSNLVIRSR